MHQRTLLILCLFPCVLVSCKDEPVPSYEPNPLRANLKNAVLIGVVADETDSGQQAARVGVTGARKNGVPLCEDLTVAQLEELATGGGFAYDCENPSPLSYCQEIPPDKLATGRVECQERPWRTGELIAVDHEGNVFSALPFMPEWNEVTRVQQSEGSLLVTLKHPMKMLRTDDTTEYCSVLYYVIDTQSDSVTPYCLEYVYHSVFCFGPWQPDGAFVRTVKDSDETCPYEEKWTDDGVCVTPASSVPQNQPGVDFPAECHRFSADAYSPAGYVHVTPHAIYESLLLGENGVFADTIRIVAGNQEGFYPMNINGYTRRGIISAGTYYTFDAGFQSLSAPMSGEPLTLGAPLAGSMAAEIGSKILYGFWDSNFNDYSSTVATSATSIPLHFFDTETLEDGTLMIDLSPHPLPFDPFEDKNWRFVAAIGDHLFLEESRTETSYFFSVDLGDVLPAIWLAHQSTGVSQWAGTTIATSSFAVSFASGTPFMAYLMKPDGTMAEVNADMLGFNPQTIEVEEDQIVVTGMDGLTPRRFIINPLATEDGELLVETATDTIPMKTLIPLQ